MTEEFEVKMSPLSQTISSGGKTVQVDIYEDGKGKWILEVVDDFNNSTVWDEPFETDSSALTEAKKTILAEGMNTLIGPESGKGEWS
ncbi:MAG: hypothetical protein GY931_22100 [Maribacter sp.]|nr:hypothetical protein [Maribacter sp.]